MATRWNFTVSILLFFSFPELIFSAVVTLDSLEIYTSHEWIASRPTVYFKCSGEDKIVLPDVKKTHTVYSFKGEESFQPLTDFPSKKCKRCGFYEEDHIKFDDVFDEWEFCPSEFRSSDGRYIRTKGKEFNATFLCHECVKEGKSANSDTIARPNDKGNRTPWFVIIVVFCIVASTIFVAGLVVAYKYWQKRKRQQEQARFMKLFEDTDDIEDELGVGSLSDSI